MQHAEKRYELVHRFARGETADLWLARRHGAAKFVRSCVLKMLLPELHGDDAAVERFLAEARSAALMQHRNIVQVLDLGQLEGRHFAAVELIDGPDLAGLLSRSVLRKAPIAPEIAAWIIAGAAAGLHYAHQLTDPATAAPLGLVHGQLSPASILASWHGSVRAVGFGGATHRVIEAVAARAVPYAAPEALAGAPIDARSDVFSLGRIFVALLAGRALKAEDTLSSDGVRALLRGVPTPLLEIAAACCHADPAKRPVSAGWVHTALLRWLHGKGADGGALLAEFVTAWALDLCPAKRAALSDGDARPRAETRDAAVDHNLERPTTALIGGQRALSRATEHLAGGKRLICLRGAAGIGKSRIALELAWARVDAGGVAVTVELHGVDDLMAACAAIADALGGALPGAVSSDAAIAAVADALGAAGPVLLVLDGIDGIGDVAPTLLQACLDGAPNASIVATSRRRLAADAATGVIVQPLRLPAGGGDPLRAEACRLFVERAKAVNSGFSPDRSEAALVARIVNRLDGIPLAIELAAARMDELDLQTLLTKLKRGIGVLHAKRRGKRMTLRGAIGWSWTMLQSWERQALVQVSVFRGGFDLEGARAVVQHGEGKDVAEVIQDLRDRSLLRSLSGDADTARFGLFDSIRAYVEELPDSAALLDTAERAHARHMLQWASEQHAVAWSHDGPDAVDKMVAERDNLTAVHERALARQPRTAEDVHQALLIPVLLYPAMIERGPQGLLLDLFAGAIEAADSLPAAEQERVDRADWARALALHADMIGNTGRAKDGVLQSERAIELAAETDDLRALALAHYSHAITLRLGDHMQHSVQAAKTARALCQQTGDLALESQALNVIGGVFYDLGEREMAAGCFHASLAAARQAGHYMQVARCTGNLGCVYADRGDMERAAPYFHESLGDARSKKNRRGEGVIHSYLGIVAQEQGNVGLARVHYKRGLELLAQVGDRHRGAYVEGLLAGMHAEVGELEEAERLLRGIIDEFVARGDWRLRAMYLCTLAFLRSLRGDRPAADHLLNASRKLAGQQSDPSALGVLDVFAAGVDLLLGDPGQRALAEDVLAAVSAPRPADEDHPDGRPPLTLISSEVRTALRILRANGAMGQSGRPPPATTPSAALGGA